MGALTTQLSRVVLEPEGRSTPHPGAEEELVYVLRGGGIETRSGGQVGGDDCMVRLATVEPVELEAGLEGLEALASAFGVAREPADRPARIVSLADVPTTSFAEADCAAEVRMIAFRGPITLLTYGTREPNDICYYPRSNKIAWWGVGVVGRIEKLDYWDGEPG